MASLADIILRGYTQAGQGFSQGIAQAGQGIAGGVSTLDQYRRAEEERLRKAQEAEAARLQAMRESAAASLAAAPDYRDPTLWNPFAAQATESFAAMMDADQRWADAQREADEYIQIDLDEAGGRETAAARQAAQDRAAGARSESEKLHDVVAALAGRDPREVQVSRLAEVSDPIDLAMIIGGSRGFEARRAAGEKAAADQKKAEAARRKEEVEIRTKIGDQIVEDLGGKDARASALAIRRVAAFRDRYPDFQWTGADDNGFIKTVAKVFDPGVVQGGEFDAIQRAGETMPQAVISELRQVLTGEKATLSPYARAALYNSAVVASQKLDEELATMRNYAVREYIQPYYPDRNPDEMLPPWSKPIGLQFVDPDAMGLSRQRGAGDVSMPKAPTKGVIE